MSVRVLDGLLNLVPPGVSFEHASTMSSLADAYKWNEAAAGGRLGLFTLYAQIWDRAEPKESFQALTAWHAGLPAGTRSLLSAQQIGAFCRTGQVQAETLTRGQRGAWLVNFSATLSPQAGAMEWHLVVDGPRSQVEAFELAQRLQAGGGRPAQIRQAVARNTAGVDELLARADGLQTSHDPMAAAHHRANVLFNIMRGGVFLNGTTFDRSDLLAFVRQRHRVVGDQLAVAAAGWPEQVPRDTVLAAARENGLRSVCTINLVIGELRELRQEWIQHYFDYLSAGSAAEGARLLVRTVPAAFGCEDCRCEFSAAIDPAQAAPGGAWDTTRCPECQAATSLDDQFCTQCGAQFPKWAGQCGDCGAWNSLIETVAATPVSTSKLIHKPQG